MTYKLHKLKVLKLICREEMQSNASFTSSSTRVQSCNCRNLTSIHYLGMCHRLVEFLLNLKVKNCAAIVRLSCIRLVNLQIFANFDP